MPEYIEREATIATIAKHMASVNAHCYSVNHNKELYDLYAMDTDHAIDYVRCVPTADVVPVVRCKDCERRNKSADLTDTVYCKWFRTVMQKTDFCSYGKRRGDGK